jgi:hypothetical protein
MQVFVKALGKAIEPGSQRLAEEEMSNWKSKGWLGISRNVAEIFSKQTEEHS